MKAYVLRGIGNIAMEEVADPQPGKGEVIVAVRAAGVCGSDIPRIYRTGAYHYPLIPGHEFSGIVSEVGEEVDRSWLGRRVGIFPLLPCKKCDLCRQEAYEMCRDYSYLGSRTDGGFAEYVRVPVWNLLPLPDSVSFEQAAMLEPMAVAAHAMRRLGLAERVRAGERGSVVTGEGLEGRCVSNSAGGMRSEKCESGSLGNGSIAAYKPCVAADSRIAICGLGTVGLLLLMLLKEAGVSDLIVLGKKDVQKEKAMGFGISEENYFDVRSGSADEWLRSKGEEKGIDAFVDCAGSREAAEWAICHTAPGGKVVLVGNPSSDMGFDRQTWWKVLRNQLTVMGIWNSSFTHRETDDWHYCLDRLEQGKLKPEHLITHRLPFEELPDGLKAARDRKEGCIKVMGILG